VTDEETYYQLPAVMAMPHRPQSQEDLLRWCTEVHSSIFDNYIPQTDRIENMVMVGETLTERPDAIGSRRFYYHRPNRTLYLDVRYGGDDFWDIVFSTDATTVTLDTTNFDNILGPTDADLQQAMDTLDDHTHLAVDIPVDTSGFAGVLDSFDDEVQHALDTLDAHTHTVTPPNAEDVPTDTTDFDGILSVADDDVQKALDTLDDITHADLPDDGTYDHAAIDTHIDDGTIHFTIGDLNLGDYVKRDGTTPMTADWDYGAFDLTNINEVEINDKLTVTGPGTPALPAVDLDSSYMKVGHVGVAGSNPTSTHMLYGTETYTNPGANVVGLGFFPTWRQTVAATNTLWGVQGNVFFGGGGFGANSQVVGMQFFPAPHYTGAAPYGNFNLETYGVQTGGCINVLGKQVKLKECTGIAVAGFVEIFGGAGASQIIDAWGIKVGDSVTPTVGGFFTRLTGVEIAKQTAAASNIGLFMSGDGVGADIVFGAGKDAHMHYDGSDFIIDTSLIAPSDVLLECGTEKTLELQTTVWEDLRVAAQNTKINPSKSEPAFVSWKDGLFQFRFLPGNDDDESLHFTVQMPHSWKEGTTLYPHIHWSPDTTNTGNVKWELEYTVIDVNGTFPSSTTITQVDAADGTIDKHQVTSLPTISGSGLNISWVMVCRLTRLGDDGQDTYTGNVFFHEFDIHYEVETLGSRQEFVK